MQLSWVKTKIHKDTIDAKTMAGNSYELTIQKLGGGDCTPMDKVIDCCDWALNSPRDVLGGRNFSVIYDDWGSEELSGKLRNNFNLYKLRRYGND